MTAQTTLWPVASDEVARRVIPDAVDAGRLVKGSA